MAIGPVAASAGLKVRTVLTDDPTDDNKAIFLRQSEEALYMIQSLQPDENLVLFTPVIPPLSPSQPTEHPIDPFEPLGRALSRHHRRIQHVPFVPAMGATATHHAFLRQADVAIVVVCDAPNVAGASRRISLADQINFAEAMQRFATALGSDDFGGYSGGNPTPLLVLLLIERDRLWDIAQETTLFETVLHCGSYRPETLRHAADVIFNRSAAARPDAGQRQGEHI